MIKTRYIINLILKNDFEDKPNWIL